MSAPPPIPPPISSLLDAAHKDKQKDKQKQTPPEQHNELDDSDDPENILHPGLPTPAEMQPLYIETRQQIHPPLHPSNQLLLHSQSDAPEDWPSTRKTSVQILNPHDEAGPSTATPSTSFRTAFNVPERSPMRHSKRQRFSLGAQNLPAPAPPPRHALDLPPAPAITDAQHDPHNPWPHQPAPPDVLSTPLYPLPPPPREPTSRRRRSFDISDILSDENTYMPRVDSMPQPAPSSVTNVLTAGSQINLVAANASGANPPPAVEIDEVTPCEPPQRTDSATAAAATSSTDKSKPVWKCDRCGVSIRGKKGNLNRHIANKHDNIRNFPCTEPNCGRKFQTRLNLVRHRTAVHLGRPFTCTNCPRAFKYENDLTMHIRSAHEEACIKLECEVCKSCFGRRSTLNRHMVKVHKINLDNSDNNNDNNNNDDNNDSNNP